MASKIVVAPAPGGWIVLGLLLDRGPQSGYELATLAARSIDHFWPITKAQIYAELPKLETLGYLTGVDVAQTNAPDKRVYKPTRSGELAFRGWINAGRLGEAKTRHPLLLKIWFGAHLPKESLKAALLEQQTRQSKALARYRTLLKQLVERRQIKARRETPDEKAFRRLAIRHAILRLEAEQSWLDEVSTALNARRM